jgi:pimeloyl-ACP methyl ester carboxylesterase
MQLIHLSKQVIIMNILKNILIDGSSEKKIVLDLFYKQNGTPKSIVVFSHGFKGFKDWGHFNLLAEKFAEHNFVFIKFNFSYNGATVEHPTEFNDLEAFGNNNYSIELDDLAKVIDWTLSTTLLTSEINPQELYLLGHSRGGGISILKAHEDKRIKKIVTWAAVADFIERIKNYDLIEWKEKGVLYSMNGRTNQQMPLYFQLYENTFTNSKRLNIINAAKELNIPFLIIHGTTDEAVSLEDAKLLHSNCKTSELLLIENAGHTFGAKHPFESILLPAPAEIVLNKTIVFFSE